MSPHACSTTRFKRRIERIKSAFRGRFPQSSLDPQPRGITGSPAIFAILSTAATSSGVPGSTTICGVTPSTVSCADDSRMCSAPISARRSPQAVSTPATDVSESALPNDGFVSIRLLKKLRDSGYLQRMWLVRAGSLRTETRARENLARIRKLFGIEGAAHQLHRLQVRLRKHFRHHHLFLFANAMFACARSAAGDAQPQNIDRKLHGALLLTRNACVINHQRVQVPITRMKDIGHAQSLRGTHALDFAKNSRQRGSRNNAILHDIVR